MSNVVMAFGTFDVVHPGHEYFLIEAKKYGEKLIVAIARDKSVLKFKGQLPIYYENERLQHISSLQIADEVILGHESDYFFYIKKFQPDFIALGYDQSSLIFELSKFLHEHNLKTKVVTIDSYYPEKYKSSIIKLQGTDN